MNPSQGQNPQGGGSQANIWENLINFLFGRMALQKSAQQGQNPQSQVQQDPQQNPQGGQQPAYSQQQILDMAHEQAKQHMLQQAIIQSQLKGNK